MKAHDEIVTECDDYVPYWLDTHKEFHPCPGLGLRADLVVFESDTRRPMMVVEVKPALKLMSDVTAAVDQVARYGRYLCEESHNARVLPVVVAGHISCKIDATEFAPKALVWTLEMFRWIVQEGTLESQRDWFCNQRPDGLGSGSITFCDLFRGFRNPYPSVPTWVKRRRNERKPASLPTGPTLSPSPLETVDRSGVSTPMKEAS